jgi:TRAP transporter TAXI family solute receptor
VRAEKRILGIMFLAFLSLMEFALPPESPGAGKKYLSLGTGNPGGTFYFIGAGFASIFNKYVPEVRVIAESTAASAENFNYLMRRRMNLGLCGLEILPPLIQKKTDFSGIRLFAVGHSSDCHWIVRSDSPVKNVADFRGRRVAVGAPGSGTLISAKEVLSLISGLSFEDFKPALLSFSESVTAVKDGTVDVGLVQAGFPVASVLDLGQHQPIRLVSYTSEEIDRLTSQRPHFVKIIIPKGTYRGVDTDTITFGTVAAIFCREDLESDLAYKLMRALYEHPRERDAIHPQAKQWNLENIFRATAFINQHIPFHPGAVKYLKEKGIWKGGK